MQTLYIVPAMTDPAGQCRIVSTEGKPKDPAALYRARPDLWKEFGLMNSRGKLVCANAAGQEIKDMEPLMAGMTITLDDAGRVV